jgi:hypothetical protein
VPVRRRLVFNPPRTAPQPAVPSSPALIENQRERLFAELAQLRALHGPSARSIETARVLLTRWWVKANWRTREKLVASAEWLVRLECTRVAEQPRS